MTTALMTPLSFDGLALDGSAGISASSFRVPLPDVLSRVYTAAGGYRVDLNYGYDSQLVPQPFPVALYFESTTAAGLETLVTSVLAPPVLGVGKLGVTGYFIATIHGGATQYRCTATLTAPGVSLSGAIFGPGTKKLSGVQVVMEPVDLMVEI